MKVCRNILSRGLAKTQQTITFAAGDDGDHEAGWWPKLLNANNRTRFISYTIAGDDVVYDRATGLWWAADGNALGCNNGLITDWDSSVNYCTGLIFAARRNWFLPNARELFSLANQSIWNPAIDEPPFSNTHFDYKYWTSTTRPNFTVLAYVVDFDEGRLTTNTKTVERYLRAVSHDIL